jgi:hypothetical protein
VATTLTSLLLDLVFSTKDREPWITDGVSTLALRALIDRYSLRMTSGLSGAASVDG